MVGLNTDVSDKDFNMLAPSETLLHKGDRVDELLQICNTESRILKFLLTQNINTLQIGSANYIATSHGSTNMLQGRSLTLCLSGIETSYGIKLFKP